MVMAHRHLKLHSLSPKDFTANICEMEANENMQYAMIVIPN